MMSESSIAAGSARLSSSRAWEVWGIFKQEILFLSWALMEIALLTPFALFIMRWSRFWPAGQIFLWLLCLMLLPFNLARFLSALQMLKKYQWLTVLFSLMITLLITWRVLLFSTSSFFDFGWLGDLYGNLGESGSALWTGILILFFLTVFAWWRGLGLLNLNADVHAVGLRLRVGILLFVLLALLPNSRTSPWGIMPFVLLFVLAGLTAIALIRADQIEGERSGFSASLSPRWVGTIFLTSLLVVLSAGILATAVSGDNAGLIGAWLSPVRVAFLAGTAVALSTLFFLSTPLFFLFELFLVWLTQIFSSIFINISENLNINLPANLGTLDSFLPKPEEAAEVTGFTIPDYLTRALALLAMLAVILLISMALTRRFRKSAFAPRTGKTIQELGAEDLDSPTLGRRLLQRLGLLQRWRLAASIRNIYLRMCYAAEGVGYPRSATETPYEYLETLAKVWPDGRAESLLITEAYIRIRYGEIPENKDELEEIQEAWRTLEQTKPAE